MSTIKELLKDLHRRNIQLWAEGDRLCYRAPKGALTPALQAQLHAHKPEMLSLLKSTQTSEELAGSAIVPIPRNGPLFLSFAQQRLWFLDQFTGPSAIYNMPAAVRLQGTLQVGVLEQVVSEMVCRHEPLRTVFATVDGAPVQVINPPTPQVVPVIDLQDLPAAEQEAEMERLATEEAQRHFDLERGPLLRVMVLRLSPEDHVLLTTMHHIISDGWSIGVFIRESIALYMAFVEGQPSPLPPLSIHYADYAHWQRLQGEELEQQLDYWRQQLGGELPVLNLPTDRPRPAVQTYRGAQHSISLSTDLTAALNRLSQQANATLFMTLLAAFQTLLYRYCGQEDIIVGSPIAGRRQRQLEELIGFFVNTLALRTDLSGSPRFRDLLERVRQVALDAYAHQDIPFEKLVEELKPDRDPSRSPVFQVMFVLQNAPTAALTLPGLTITPLNYEATTAKFDLLLSLTETEEGLKGNFGYNTDLFEAATIERMVVHFQTLLEGIVANPEQSIATLPILTERERHQLLVEWNDTQVEYPQDKCIHQLFEEQVERTPDAVAVELDQQQLTYQELNARANQLAHYLQSLGVGPEVLVGICVERSIEMVVGLLGILKAGGAYVPLDPTYPPQRLTFMVENAQTTVILTQESLERILPTETASLVCVDADGPTIAQQERRNLNIPVTPDDLAYVIYTSGSTGQPKGVCLNHRPLVNLLAWQLENPRVGLNGKTLQFSPVSFDVSFQEIFSTWLAGGTLVLIADDARKDPVALLQFLNAHEIERLFLPFVALQSLIEIAESRNQSCPSLREVITAGEQLQITPTIANWFSRHPNCVLSNHYGPSESHVVTAYALTGDPQTWPTLPPIGRPIWNTELFLLDPHGQPVPIGIAGELFISVDDPVRGYINWPELTSDRFLPNLFSQASDVRLYKTGDLARYLFDGNIEFLGRIDNQVKIRGFRIELGEIEAALSQHPAIQQCVMLAREDQPGDKRLVAYVVAEGEAPSTQELQHFLKQTLPDYMIPSVFVPLESLPLTPSGKVDRKVLPTPDRTDFVPSAPYVASRTQLEQKLAKIWAEVLQLEQVGIHDNFFELGGHSLLAAQLIGHLQKATSATIPLQLLFKAPTIAALAQAIEEQIESSTKTEASETTPLPLLLSSIPRAASERQLESISTPFSKIERRPLLSLFTTEYIASVDSVALGYVPAAMLDQFPLSGNELLEIGFGNQPLLNRMIQTEWGRIGLILLPHFSSELYSNQTELIHKIVDALKLAKFLGARTVSLTGLIPSATDYGYGVIKALQGRDDLPRVTTGHATTCSTVVLTIEKIVQLAARDFTKERVGFVGLGSIGASTLRLMLKCLPHPAEITLADIYSKLSVLEAFRQELVDDFGFKGDLRIVESRHEAPSEIYQSTLIVGATNVPDIVDVAQLLPGTLIVDDSAPHCFSADKAIQRFQKRQDILFTEGGVLGSPSPMHTLTYVPPLMDQMMPPNYLESLINRNPHHITGCVFSSLLSAQFEGIEPTLGEIDLHQLLKHFEILKQLKFQAADLHCEDYVLSEEGIQSFRQQFSQLNRNSEYR